VGAPGAQGVQGPIGYTGSQGLQGVQGAVGAQGVQGATGAPGAQGVQGPIGYTGSQGLQGVQGAAGAQGIQGAQGPQGAQGAVGAQGAQGVQGPIGYTGSQGLQGVQGAAGAQGIQGAVGAPGAQGVQGAVGAPGAQGVQGATGPQGVQGAVGAQGAQGVQGAPGPVAGSTTQIIFNDGGFANGSPNLTFNKATNTLTVAGPAAITGDLTVSGTQTIVNTNIVSIGDAIITLNGDLPPASAPTENAGIEVNRGSSANVQFLWDETNDRWSTNNQPFIAGNTTISGFATVSSARGGVATPTAGQNNSALYVTNSDTAYGILFGSDPATGQGFIQAQRTDGTATTYNLRLNPAGGGVEFENNVLKDSVTTTTTAVTPFALISLPAATYGSLDVTIQATQGTERELSRLAVTSNSSNAISTEYATLLTSTNLFSVETDLTGGNIRVMVTPASATSTTFRASYEAIRA